MIGQPFLRDFQLPRIQWLNKTDKISSFSILHFTLTHPIQVMNSAGYKQYSYF